MAGFSFNQPLTLSGTTLWYKTEKENSEQFQSGCSFILDILDISGLEVIQHQRCDNISWAHSCQIVLKTPFSSHIFLPVHSALWITSELLWFFFCEWCQQVLFRAGFSLIAFYIPKQRPSDIYTTEIFISFKYPMLRKCFTFYCILIRYVSMSIGPTYGYARWVKDISLNRIIFWEMLKSQLMCTNSRHHRASFETWHKLLQQAADVFVMLSQLNVLCPKKTKEIKQV